MHARQQDATRHGISLILRERTGKSREPAVNFSSGANAMEPGRGAGYLP